MKQLTRVVILFLFATVFTSASSAKWTDNQFGLSDSCWQVFLSQLSGDDSAFGSLYDSAGTIDEQIDSLMKLIPGLKGKGVKDLQKQIIELRKQRIAVHKQLKSILKANIGLLLDVREHCGRPDTTITDTTDTTGGDPTDTTGGDTTDTTDAGDSLETLAFGVNQLGLSDSCWQVFLAQLSGDDSVFGSLYDSAGMLDMQIDSMMKLIPGLRGKAVQTLQKQIIALRKQRIEIHKQMKAILKANLALLLDIREHCGQDTTITDTTDTTGGGGMDSLTIGLNPNPVLIGGSTTLTFTLAAPANVMVNVFSQTTATLVQTFTFPGLPAGPQALLLDLSSLPSGSYLIQVQSGTTVGTATLLIL